MSILQQEFKTALTCGMLVPVAGKPKEKAFVFASDAGVIAVQNLKDGSMSAIGKGYIAVTGMAIADDGKTIFIADFDAAKSRTTVYQATLANAGKTAAQKLFTEPGQVMQLAVEKKLLYYVDQLQNTFSVFNLTKNMAKVISSGLAKPVGLLLDSKNGKAYISQLKGGSLLEADISTGATTVLLNGLKKPAYLSWAGATTNEIIFTEASTTDTVKSYHTTKKQVSVLVGDKLGTTVVAAWLHNSLLIINGLKRFWWFDLKPSFPVQVKMTNKSPFIGTFERLVLNFGTTGLGIDDIDFRFSKGEASGRISLSRDNESAANEIMLLLGYEPGKHKLEIIQKGTATVLSVVEYEIVDVWKDNKSSPSHWVTGNISHFTTGYTWGGGPSTPQNVDVVPQSGVRNICILMVDTSSARYPTGAAFTTIQNQWVNGAVGTAADPDGKVRSAKSYFEEVSRNVFTLNLSGGQAPLVSLPNAWTDYFTMMTMPWPGNSFAPIDGGAFAQACVSSAAALVDGGGNPLINFQQVQTLILVVRSQGPAGADNFFWPQAWGGAFTVPGGSASMAVLGMPDDWNPTRDSRTIFETLAHEIGHNLGLPDLYTNANTFYSPAVQARDITNFDLMSSEQSLPHLSIGNKMQLGWVRPEWVLPLDFSRSTVPLDMTVDIHASELGAPPAGRVGAVEVRIADGWNYYFEYRAEQTTQIGDQEFQSPSGDDTGTNVVLGSDMISASFTFPIARPQIMRLQRDAENENSFFDAGEDYKETDASSMAVSDFNMTVISTSVDFARVRIRYGTNGRPDLYIRPWPGGDNWQSPDIEVQNTKSLSDPAFRNQPWIGHPNTLVARYRNRGPVTARNVRVNFYIRDFTVGGAPEVFLGSDTKDVPPETSTPFVEFTTPWVPLNDGHKCIIARTALYIDTSVNPNIVEVTDSNNEAQTNYTRYIAASASPARRAITEVSLHNPFDKETNIYVIPQIKGLFAKFYRLYLEHSSLRLKPGQTKKVKVMVESEYAGQQWFAEQRKKEKINEKFFFEDTRMALIGYGVPPATPEHPVLLGGAQINVASGRATKFEQFANEGNGIFGRVIVVDDGSPAAGKAYITFFPEKEAEAVTATVTLGAKGEFFIRDIKKFQRVKAKRISAHYGGRPGFGPCDAEKDILL